MERFEKAGRYWKLSFCKTKFLVRPIKKLWLRELSVAGKSLLVVFLGCLQVRAHFLNSWGRCPVPWPAGLLRLHFLFCCLTRFKRTREGNLATLVTPGHSVATVCFPSFAVILGNVQTENTAPELLGLFGNTSAGVLGAFFTPTPSDHTEFLRVSSCSGQKQNLSFKFRLSQGYLVADKSV